MLAMLYEQHISGYGTSEGTIDKLHHLITCSYLDDKCNMYLKSAGMHPEKWGTPPHLTTSLKSVADKAWRVLTKDMKNANLLAGVTTPYLFFGTSE
jgi:hypothetical protein